MFFFAVSELITTENKLLSSKPTPIEKQAGIDTFNKFGVMNTVNSLAGGDVLKWELVKQLPYEMYLTKLLMNKTESEYQKKYSKLLEQENKSKR